MHIGFTGTREGMTSLQKSSLDELLFAFNKASITANQCFHHGGCLGADVEAHLIALQNSIEVILHPPEDDKKRAFCRCCKERKTPKPYIDRNHDIVDAANILIAAPKSLKEELRSGTWATIRYARKRKVRTIILVP